MIHQDKDLGALLLHGLGDVNFVEHAILKALPKMARAAASPVLKQALDTHARQTEAHVERLEQVFQLLDEKPVQEPCDAIQGLILEGDAIIEEFEGATLDAGLISAAQAIEHYEMARYGTLRAWADQLDLSGAAKFLGETLAEEKEVDDLLTKLATERINAQAAAV
jgi:ferritin-like metal-binding protein YciE